MRDLQNKESWTTNRKSMHVEYLLKLLLSGDIQLLEDISFSKIQSTESVLNNTTYRFSRLFPPFNSCIPMSCVTSPCILNYENSNNILNKYPVQVKEKFHHTVKSISQEV